MKNKSPSEKKPPSAKRAIQTPTVLAVGKPAQRLLRRLGWRETGAVELEPHRNQLAKVMAPPAERKKPAARKIRRQSKKKNALGSS